MIALNVSTIQKNSVLGAIIIKTSLATANFPDRSGGFNAARMVTCEETELTNNNDGYLFSPSATNPTDIEFDHAVN